MAAIVKADTVGIEEGDAVKGLAFEERGEGHYYKVILHIDQCYVPISDDTLEALIPYASAPPDQFLPIFLDKVSYSSYLRERIEAALRHGPDANTQISRLQQFLQTRT